MRLPAFLKRPHVGTIFLGVLVLFFSTFIRIQGVESFPSGQFTEHGAYLYFWQASIISEHGHLLERDMSRWLPTR